jgi:hypothetical protein
MNVLRYRIGFSKLLIEKVRISCQHPGINWSLKSTNECLFLVGCSVGIQEGTAVDQERIQQSSTNHHGVRLFWRWPSAGWGTDFILRRKLSWFQTGLSYIYIYIYIYCHSNPRSTSVPIYNPPTNVLILRTFKCNTQFKLIWFTMENSSKF